MKLLLLVSLLFIRVCSFSQLRDFNLEGVINDLEKGDNVFLHYFNTAEWNGGSKTDSLIAAGTSFKFRGKVAEGWPATLIIKRKNSGVVERLPFFLQPGKTEVNSSGALPNAVVKGGTELGAYASFLAQEKGYGAVQDSLAKLFTVESDPAKKEAFREKIDSFLNIKKELIYLRYFRSAPNSELSVYALRQGTPTFIVDPAVFLRLFDQLTPIQRNTPAAVDLKTKLDGAMLTALNTQATDFVLPDTAGRPVRLSDFRGKYVLVDFWASWCGPCRVENPNIVAVYNKFRDRGFTVLGVSLDRPGKRENWLQAIATDQLRWTQLSDLKYWDSDVAKLYGIKALPFNLLLDPNGKIIGKNLRGPQLHQVVANAVGSSH